MQNRQAAGVAFIKWCTPLAALLCLAASGVCWLDMVEREQRVSNLEASIKQEAAKARSNQSTRLENAPDDTLAEAHLDRFEVASMAIPFSPQPNRRIKTGSSTGDELAEMRLFAQALDEIERNYVEVVERRELIEAAIEGMTARLDQHSTFIPPDQTQQFRGTIENEYGGIGVQVSIKNDWIEVISPYFGSPAYDQGIMAGDTILSIEGESTKGMSLDQAAELTTGEVGTPVTITVRHRHDGVEEELELVRAVIKLETVLGDRRLNDDHWDYFVDAENRIGYIRLTGFGRTTAAELRAEIESLVDDDLRGLILDMRFNPGGLLTSAIEICDMFVRDGVIVSTQGRSTRPRTWTGRQRATLPDFPMVVLVNRYSASASEIVAACLQDHERAVIMGERTFGKGSVQNVIMLEEGESILKLTTARYYRPSGDEIHRTENATEDDVWGVMPNDGFSVRFDDNQVAAYLLDRRQRDAIGFESASPEESDSASSAESNGGPRQFVSAQDDATTQEVPDDQQTSEPFVDTQLEMAIQYLQQMLSE